MNMWPTLKEVRTALASITGVTTVFALMGGWPTASPLAYAVGAIFSWAVVVAVDESFGAESIPTRKE